MSLATLKRILRLKRRLLRFEKELEMLANYEVTVLGEKLPLVAEGECVLVSVKARGLLIKPLYAHARKLSKLHKVKFTLLHRCDTPLCINYDHIAYGTYSDNARDCALKGRMLRSGRKVDASLEAREARRRIAEQEVAKLKSLLSE